MDDLNKFLNWYLGVRTRMKRSMFNIVFFVAFIPVVFLKLNSGLETVSGKADKYAPLMGMLESAMDGGNNFDSGDLRGVINKREEVADMTRQLMDDFGGDYSDSYKEKELNPTNWADIIKFLTFLALVPIVQMRLRDLGKWNTELWVYTGLIYSGIILDSLKSLLHIEFSFLLIAAGGILTLVMLSWACMAKSRQTKTTITAEDNYMPGDNPDDPY